MLIQGGQLTVNLGRIHEDFARITSDSVDPGRESIEQSTWEGSMKTLQGLPQTVLILEGFNRQSTWEGSTKTLQGLPLTVLILGGGGSIDSQLGKDLQRLCKDYLIQC